MMKIIHTETGRERLVSDSLGRRFVQSEHWHEPPFDIRCSLCGIKPLDGFGEGDMCHCEGRFCKVPTKGEQP